MADEDDYIPYDRVGWNVNKQINPPIANQETLVRMNFWTIVDFMQDKGLTRRKLAASVADMTDEFPIGQRELTYEGEVFFSLIDPILARWWNWEKSADELMEIVQDRAPLEKVYKKLLKKLEQEKQQQSAAPAAGSANRPVGKKKPAGRGGAGQKKTTVKAMPASPDLDLWPPSGNQRQAPAGSPQWHKYDDAGWHSEKGFPEDLTEEAAATPIGMFTAWAFLTGLASEETADDFEDEIEALQTRDDTPASALKMMEGVFTSDELSAQGNAFAMAYYGASFAKSQYGRDYLAVLAAGLPSLYHVADSWATFDRLKPVLDMRFADWKAAR